MKIQVISGANLNILERRGAEYGGISYNDLIEAVKNYAHKSGAETEFFISNFEGEIIEKIQSLSDGALIINVGALSHYSLAVADSLKALHLPKIEVHLTNIHKTGRPATVTGAVCDGVICGLGLKGYFLAIDYLIEHCRSGR